MPSWRYFLFAIFIHAVPLTLFMGLYRTDPPAPPDQYVIVNLVDLPSSGDVVKDVYAAVISDARPADRRRRPDPGETMPDVNAAGFQHVQALPVDRPLLPPSLDQRLETHGYDRRVPADETPVDQRAQQENDDQRHNRSALIDAENHNVGSESSRPTGNMADRAPGFARFGAENGPVLIHLVRPQYPLLARRRGMEGRVVLSLFIDSEGRIKEATVVESAGNGFDEAALRAVFKSRFGPARRDGIAIACRALLPVKFELSAAIE